MRVSPLKDRFASQGAVTRERYGVEVVARVTDKLTECRAVRDAVGLADFSFTRKYRIPAEQGLDFLDGLLAGKRAQGALWPCPAHVSGR